MKSAPVNSLSAAASNYPSKLLEQLTQQFQQLNKRQTLVIVDSVFDYGLTFLAVANLWRQNSASAANNLHYLALVKKARPAAEVTQCWQNYPQYAAEAAELAREYYLLLTGYQRIKLSRNVSLTLLIGESNHQQLHLIQPAWLIDENVGLSPWANQTAAIKPWYAYPLPINSTLPAQPAIAVIGGGISGAATAYSLACRGFKVNVYEKNPQPAEEASGNYQAMLYSSWSSFGGEMMELCCSSFRYSHQLISRLLTKDQDYQECGLIQLAHNPQQLKRNLQLLAADFSREFFYQITHSEAETISGQKLAMRSEANLFFPHGLWLQPRRLVARLLEHPNINLITACEIDAISQAEQEWLLYDQKQQLVGQASHVILCNAYAANHFVQTAQLPLRKIRGQISIAPEQQTKLTTILCADGYITPALNKHFTLGASFKFNDQALEVRNSEHVENLQRFATSLPELVKLLKLSDLRGQVNFRTSSYDYLPIVGPIALYDEFIQNYQNLSLDKNYRINTPCNYHRNLFVNLAQGSKGMLTAPLCGEIIADYIQQTPLPCSEKLRTSLHPNRFYVKKLIKHKS